MARVSHYTRGGVWVAGVTNRRLAVHPLLSDRLRAELDKQQNRGAALHELLRQELDRGAVLRGTIGRLEDTIEKLLGYTECGCGEDEEGHYGKCVPCTVRDEGVYS